MNKSTFVKFSLTLLSAAVLSACSGGGSNGSNAGSTASTNNTSAEEAARLAKEAAAKEAAEKEAALKTKDTNNPTIGHKLVQKNGSNFVVRVDGETKDSSTGRSDVLDIKDPHKSFDTIVVSTPLVVKDGVLVWDASQPAGYLEDFDFRGNAANTSGTHTLSHIYKDGKTTGTAAGQARTTGYSSETKTATMGSSTGVALVYKEGKKVHLGKDIKDASYVTSNLKDTNDALLETGDTVAEVYGHRTFVNGDSATGIDAVANAIPDLKNAPLASGENYEDGAKYNHVQYGRVTSKLHDVKPADTKKGLEAGQHGTKVVSYGEFGKQGTENHYFYRGLDHTAYDADLAGKLKKAYNPTSGSLTYQGHAVTYGFTHKPNTATLNVPTSVRQGSEKLVSGTHVQATIDLSNKTVSGQLYDRWEVNGVVDNTGKTGLLATFGGALANDGTMSGGALRASDSAAGTFNATLFGNNGQEMGGALASSDTTKANSWGAVFGAKAIGSAVTLGGFGVLGQQQ